MISYSNLLEAEEFLWPDYNLAGEMRGSPNSGGIKGEDKFKFEDFVWLVLLEWLFKKMIGLLFSIIEFTIFDYLALIYVLGIIFVFPLSFRDYISTGLCIANLCAGF